MLGILRHNARITDAVKLDTTGMGKHGNGVFQIGLTEETAGTEDRRSGITQYFFGNVAHIVVAVELFMDKRHTFLADIG